MHHILLQVLPQLKIHLKLITQSWIIRLQIFLQLLQTFDHKISLMNLRLKHTPIEQLRLSLEKESTLKVQLRRLRQRLVNHKLKLTKKNINHSIRQESLLKIIRQNKRFQHKLKISYMVNQQFIQTLKQNNQQ